ncbi:integral membrane protein-like protein TmpA [Microdochium bolleyi]|uniref:Integral membrane protein-like protein TmpA n=1 Tax=Microdochium bolleyi TaxID=196109 RepID=A0A136ILB1_9PEZI|nr:integral membrane protein-like protein TmpA [Microdochium bolleyi]
MSVIPLEKPAAPVVKSAAPSRSFFAKSLRFISSEYRILFSIIFFLNLVGMVAFLWQWALDGRPNESTCSLAASINLAISIVIREEHVVNALYFIFTSLPSSAPLWLRRRAGKIYHLGGLHSGCAVAGTFWFILLTVEKTYLFCRLSQPSPAQYAHIAVIYLLDSLFIAMCVMAYPTIRAKLHNAFELVHRLAGWSALALLFTLICLEVYITNPPNRSLAVAVFSSANLWLVFISTCSVISTWTNCRKIRVISERLSSHALRVFFDYAQPQPGTTIRLATRPLLEWHSFAAVTNPKQEGFSVIISNAGDWTNRLITDPPRELWVRRTPTRGVLAIAPMFKSIVLVATGSGIAPCLPVILARQTNITLFWSTRDPLETYGPEIGAIITAMGENAVIHNTSTQGRPKTLPTVLDMYRRAEAEAVIVISNPKLTIDLVLDLEELGVPAFGPIWDS